MISISRIVLLFFCAFTFNTVNGQAIEQKSSEYFPKYKWSFSLDFLRLLKNGGTTVFMRYSPKGTGAYRLGLQGAYTKSTVEGLDTITNEKLIQKVVDLGITAGYEWYKPAGKHQLYYGSDFGFGYASNRAYYTQVRTVNLLPTRRYSGGVYPFVGFRYYVLDELSISCEANLKVEYSRLNNLSANLQKIGNSTKVFTLAFIPLRLINISYHF